VIQRPAVEKKKTIIQRNLDILKAAREENNSIKNPLLEADAIQPPPMPAHSEHSRQSMDEELEHLADPAFNLQFVQKTSDQMRKNFLGKLAYEGVWQTQD